MKSFKNKRILITGGAGFIGSHLTKKLVEYNSKVTVIVKYKSIIDCVRLTNVWDSIDVIEADLRNLDSILYLKSLKNNYDINLRFEKYLMLTQESLRLR